MKKTLIIFAGFLLCAIVSYGQTATSLEECKRLAVENYPLIKQYGLIEIAEKYTLENIAKNHLPQFGVSAQATYQSDVTKLPFDLSSLPLSVDMPSMSKDQYKAVIEASQLIWDGGITSSRKKIARANTEVEKHRVDVSLHMVREKINQLYFGILSVDEQLRIIALTEQSLLSNKEIAQSMFDNGMAMQSDLDLIDVELLDLEQKRIEQKSLRSASLHILSLFIHRQLEEGVVLQKPENTIVADRDIVRPELNLYNSQVSAYNAQEGSVDAKNRPYVNLFVQGGYGRPGLNMLEDRFRLFAVGGIRLSWNFGNLYTKKNEKKLIQNYIDNVEVQRETFLFNTNVELTREQSEMRKMKKLMEKDDEIIHLRKRVKTASESKYRNGVYQVNELIRDINAEAVARQSKALHEIQYLMNIYNYKHIQGY